MRFCGHCPSRCAPFLIGVAVEYSEKAVAFQTGNRRASSKQEVVADRVLAPYSRYIEQRAENYTVPLPLAQ